MCDHIMETLLRSLSRACNAIKSNNIAVAAPVSFTHFHRLPPEIRNTIYKLLVVDTIPIRITSSKGRKAKRNHFLALTLVNKLFGKEAKSIFYSFNTFIIGNGAWGLTRQPNLHGLKQFISRVPKEHLSQIQFIKIEVHFGVYIRSIDDYRQFPRQFKDLQSVIRVFNKYFTTAQTVTFLAIDSHHAYLYQSWDHATAALPGVSKAIATLLDKENTSLKQMSFRHQDGSRCKILYNKFVEECASNERRRLAIKSLSAKEIVV